MIKSQMTKSYNLYWHIFIIYTKILVIIIIALIALYNILNSTSFLYSKGLPAHIEAQDYTQYYMAGQIILRNAGQQLYNPATQNYWQKKYSADLGQEYLLRPFFYPPFAALIFIPFALLPLLYGYFIYLLFNILLLVIVYKNIFRELESKDTYITLISICLLLSYAPVIYTLVSGQVSIILTTSLVMARRFFLHRQKLIAGIWLSLLLIKPQYIILPVLFFLFRKELKVLTGFMSASILLTVLSFLLVGYKGILQYLRYFSEIFRWKNAYTINPEYMDTWRGFLQSSFHTKSFLTIAPYWITGAIIIMLMLLYIWQKKIKNTNALFDLQWSSVIIAAILMSPYTSGQDLFILIIPAILLVYWIKRLDNKKIGFLILLLFVLWGYLAKIISDVFINIVHVQTHAIYMLGVLGLLICFFYSNRKNL